jgi:hypothetical protein
VSPCGSRPPRLPRPTCTRAWRFTPKQSKALQSFGHGDPVRRRGRRRQVVLHAGAGHPAVRLIPGLNVYLFRRIYDDLIKNHMEGTGGFPVMLAPLILSGHVKIVAEEIRFWNGSRIFLCHCEHEKHRFKYQGAEIHVLLIDELTMFTEVIYRFLRGRMRAPGLEIPQWAIDFFREKFGVELQAKIPLALCGSNPGNIGHGGSRRPSSTARRRSRCAACPSPRAACCASTSPPGWRTTRTLTRRTTRASWPAWAPRSWCARCATATGTSSPAPSSTTSRRTSTCSPASRPRSTGRGSVQWTGAAPSRSAWAGGAWQSPSG